MRRIIWSTGLLAKKADFVQCLSEKLLTYALGRGLGRTDKAAVDQYAELGVDRLVLLPQPDAGPAQRHAPVPVDRILRNIDTVAQQILGS